MFWIPSDDDSHIFILDELYRYHCLALFVQVLQQDTLQHIHSTLIVAVPALSL